MPQLIANPGIEDRFRSRVGVLVRMTNVKRRYVNADVETIAQAVTDLAAYEGYDWDCWCAHKEVPWWEEDQHPHGKAELFHVTRRLVGVCDAAIIHAHENGSAALGYIYKALVDAPHHPPVLVVAHVNEQVSKVWEGQTEHHLAVRFKRFDGDELGSLEVRQVAYQWLQEHASIINEGPERRMGIEDAFRPQSQALLAAWQQLSRDDRRDVSSSLMLAEVSVRELIGNPMDLASLSSYDFAMLLGLIDGTRAAVVQDAGSILDADELAAWQLWSESKPRELALGVLAAASRERRKATIGNELADLTQQGGWETLRRRWEQGLAG